MRPWTAIKRFLNVRQTRDDREPETRRIAYNPRTQAGVLVTPDTALTVDAAFACIRYLTQTVGGLPWHVYKPVVKGGGEIADRHPVEMLLCSRPCEEYSSFQLRETMLGQALRYGNAYAEIERDSLGRPVALWPLAPGRTQVRRDRITGKLYYEVDSGSFSVGPQGGSTAATGRGIRMEPMDIFHLRGFGEGPVGLSVVDYAADVLGQAKAIQLFGAAFFGSGATPSGVVTTDKNLSIEALNEAEKRFSAQHKGPRNARKTLFLDAGMDYKQTSVAPDEGQFVESSYLAIEAICRIFGVPPHKVQHLLRATFSNIEHQSIEVVQDSVLPWARRFQDEANYKLLGLNGRQGYYSQMDLTELLRGDTASRMIYYQGMSGVGAMSANDVRASENMPGIGPKGDKYVMQSQFTTLDKIGEDPVAAAPALPKPTEKPDDKKPTVENLTDRLNALQETVNGLASEVAASTDMAALMELMQELHGEVKALKKSNIDNSNVTQLVRSPKARKTRTKEKVAA